MSSLIFFWLVALRDLIIKIYTYIFPEYPAAGIVVILLSLLFILIYILKSGLKHALERGLMIFAALTFALFALHHIGKLFWHG